MAQSLQRCANAAGGSVMKSRAFFGYPSRPEQVRVPNATASALIAATEQVDCLTWETLPVGGRLIMGQVLTAIEDSDVCVFDITTLNQNVLFELGYAVTRQKRVWLLLNESLPDAMHNWKSLDLLAPAGYIGYRTAEDVRAAFMRETPHLAAETLWDEVSTAVEPLEPRSVFYMPSLYNTESSRALTRRLEREQDFGVRLVIADPSEHGPAPLSWYVEQVYGAGATLVHLVGESRPRASVYNARSALVAGMASGLGRPVLMVVEDDYNPPLDYRDLLYKYPSRRKLLERASQWLGQLPRPEVGQPVRSTTRRLRLATELRGIRFGEHVAENESDTLDEYFIETAEYNAVLDARSAVFVGRKGVGKTASMLQAAEELRSDKRNLVCVIKPSSYEWESLVDVIRNLSATSAQSYFIEALWQFLLLSEIAHTAVAIAERQPAGITPGSPMAELRDLLEDPSAPLREEFSVRLERVVAAAAARLGDLTDTPVAEQREQINAALHGSAISVLRKKLGLALQDRNRVAILVDNLDKAWTKTAELGSLSQVLLGLLTAVGRVADEFKKRDAWRETVNVTLAVFLRGDIFSHVIREAREPDKINVLAIDWHQEELLLRVLEERYSAQRPDGTDPEELWSQFFCAKVHGKDTRRYLLDRVLHRPRDLVFLCNAAILHAVNGRRERIEPRDIVAAERAYSRFAFEALLVENGITISQLEQVLFEFLYAEQTMSKADVLAAISAAAISGKDPGEIMEHLQLLSFLGVEVAADKFEFADSEETLRRALVLARKAEDRMGRPPRYIVHAAYRPYLEIADPPS
jgi:hypothetical protein